MSMRRRGLVGRAVIAAAAITVLAYAVCLVVGAKELPSPGKTGVSTEHVMLLIIGTLAATLLHVGACIVAHRAPPRLAFVLVVGVAARLLLLVGAPAPVLEGDRDKIRFEGRLVNIGLNPYKFVPSRLTDPSSEDALLATDELSELQASRAALSASGDGPRPTDLRRPDLRTDSPPLGLWLAALGDRLKPTSNLGYAFVILCADVLAGFFLILALRSLHLPLGWLVVYAWCPVLLLAGYATHSIDLFLMPAIAGLVACIVSNRRWLGAFPLALAVAIRPVMLLLVPVAGRKIGSLGVLLTLVLASLPVLSFHTGDVAPSKFVEGQVHTWRYVEYNSALENPLRAALRHLPYRAENSLSIAGVEIVRPDESLAVLLAKVVCIIVLLGTVVYTVIRVRPDVPMPGIHRSTTLMDLFAVLVAMLLVSPVLQPNHALWLLPILVVMPMGITWLALPGVLSLSYLTHLVGPDAADLILPGGAVSFRLFQYGILLALLILDLFWRGRLFDKSEEVGFRDRMLLEQATAPEAAFDPSHDEEVALT